MGTFVIRPESILRTYQVRGKKAIINKTGPGVSIVSQPSTPTLQLVGTNPNSTPPAGANSSSNIHAGPSSAIAGTSGFVVSENSPVHIAFSPPHSPGFGFGSGSGSDSGSESPPSSSVNRNFSLK